MSLDIWEKKLIKRKASITIYRIIRNNNVITTTTARVTGEQSGPQLWGKKVLIAPSYPKRPTALLKLHSLHQHTLLSSELAMAQCLPPLPLELPPEEQTHTKDKNAKIY